MKLIVSQIKEFKERSARITTNPIIPILGFLKFEPGKVTKNNLGAFVTMDIDCDDAFLIDEKQLMAFVYYTKAKEIELTRQPGSIIISDGTLIKYDSPTDDINIFPHNDTPTDNPIPLEKDVIDTIAIAAAFNVEDANNVVRSHVFIGNGLAVGADGQIAYIGLDFNAPDMVLPKATAEAISEMQDVLFSENASYHFFSTGKFNFGFIKPSVQMMDFKPFIADLTGSPTFSVEKEYIISLCALAITRNPLPITLGKFKSDGGMLYIDFKNEAYNLNLSHYTVVEADGDIDWFGFNATFFTRLLKSVPGDKVDVWYIKNKIYVTCERFNYMALMTRISV